jgi:hypothetical protein
MIAEAWDPTWPRRPLSSRPVPVCRPCAHDEYSFPATRWRNLIENTWVACPLPLPPTIAPDAVLHLPVLRLDGDRVRADLAYTHRVPKTARAGRMVALGVDWGLSTLLAAGAAQLHDDGRITALGSGAMFRSAGVLAKQHRLRRQGEKLHARLGCYQVLIDGRRRLGLPRNEVLEARADSMRDEIRRVSGRRSNLNDALAWSAARWLADQAIAAGATVICVEDLRSMEARGMGRYIWHRIA